MSDDDGMDSSTQARAARRAWALAALSCHARHEMLPLRETPAPVVPTLCQKSPGKVTGWPGLSRAGEGGKPG
jgi:hypothetical protein